jgi:hypothetical protein
MRQYTLRTDNPPWGTEHWTAVSTLEEAKERAQELADRLGWAVIVGRCAKDTPGLFRAEPSKGWPDFFEK